MVRTGSFYDDAKVIQPDEFDYVAELQPLSHNRGVDFRTTGDPAFLQVQLKKFELRAKWREFMANAKQLKIFSQSSM